MADDRRRQGPSFVSLLATSRATAGPRLKAEPIRILQEDHARRVRLEPGSQEPHPHLVYRGTAALGLPEYKVLADSERQADAPLRLHDEVLDDVIQPDGGKLRSVARERFLDEL